jgi:hypothetical protein
VRFSRAPLNKSALKQGVFVVRIGGTVWSGIIQFINKCVETPDMKKSQRLY